MNIRANYIVGNRSCVSDCAVSVARIERQYYDYMDLSQQIKVHLASLYRAPCKENTNNVFY